MVERVGTVYVSSSGPGSTTGPGSISPVPARPWVSSGHRADEAKESSRVRQPKKRVLVDTPYTRGKEEKKVAIGVPKPKKD